MRSFIKFGIGCWTRKIELSKSMKLTKGKMSLKQEQNSYSSLLEQQESDCDLELLDVPFACTPRIGLGETCANAEIAFM